MAYEYVADKNVIESVLVKLKMDKMITQNAKFNYNDYTKLRKEVLVRDMDYMYFFNKNQILPQNKCLSRNELIEKTMTELKEIGAVDNSAYFNFNEHEKLREEVLYRDFDFLQYLGSMQEVKIVDSILSLLVERNVVDNFPTYSDNDFLEFRAKVKNSFRTPWTSLSPAMERLLYILSIIKKPKKILGIGIFAGYTFVWNLADFLSNNTEAIVYGIDIDKTMMEEAKNNFSKIIRGKHIHLISDDGCSFSERINEKFDYIYLDADSSENGKGIYMDLIKILYDKLEDNGWVLAHDTTNLPLKKQCQEYLDFVREKKNFKESISFNFDLYGLELSIK